MGGNITRSGVSVNIVGGRGVGGGSVGGGER